MRKSKYDKALDVLIKRLVKYDIKSSFGSKGNYIYSFKKREKVIIKDFASGYKCKSLFYKTCQLDCGDCGMLIKDVDWQKLAEKLIIFAKKMVNPFLGYKKDSYDELLKILGEE